MNITLDTALRIAADLDEKVWARPVAWRKTGMAYCVKDGVVHRVPDPRGGAIGITPYVNLLTDDWEIVDPDVVIAENDRMMGRLAENEQ